MGPSRAAKFFNEKHGEAERVRVTLYGSLALTGKGHGTDAAILKVVTHPERTEIVWQPDVTLPKHPNGMLFEAFDGGKLVDSWTVYSIGGGGSSSPGEPVAFGDDPMVYYAGMTYHF